MGVTTKKVMCACQTELDYIRGLIKVAFMIYLLLLVYINKFENIPLNTYRTEVINRNIQRRRECAT